MLQVHTSVVFKRASRGNFPGKQSHWNESSVITTLPRPHEALHRAEVAVEGGVPDLLGVRGVQLAERRGGQSQEDDCVVRQCALSLFKRLTDCIGSKNLYILVINVVRHCTLLGLLSFELFRGEVGLKFSCPDKLIETNLLFEF